MVMHGSVQAMGSKIAHIEWSAKVGKKILQELQPIISIISLGQLQQRKGYAGVPHIRAPTAARVPVHAIANSANFGQISGDS